MKRIYFIFLCLGLLLISSYCSAVTLNVPADYATIQAAINTAVSGDTIQIATGTYTLTAANDINGMSNITIQGAGAGSTIIDGDQTYRGFFIRDNASNITISDMTIQGCESGSGESGGGIVFKNNSTGTISDCTIQNCDADNHGGGIVVNINCTVMITDCTIYNNAANNDAGGIAINNASTVTVTDCTITDNEASAGNGGGIKVDLNSTLTMTGTTVSDNTAGNTAGAILIDTSQATIQKCTFDNNSSPDAGAVLIKDCISGTLTIENCLLTNNTSTSTASCIICDASTATINVTNCTLANNNDGAEGTITVDANTPITITNCIVANSSFYGILDLNGQTSTMINNNIYNSTNAPYAVSNGSTTPYTIAQINALAGSSGNIDGNPNFTSSTDFELQPGSAAINTATSTGAPTTDINEVTRPQRGGYDIGCYEYTTNIWYLAEGSTTSYVAGVTDGYDTWICVQNPGTIATTATLTFMDSGGTTATYSQSLAANSRMSYRINDNPGMLDLNEVSTKVEASGGTSIIAERTMYWPENLANSKVGGTCSIGTTTPATTWYLAEGSTDGYDTWICVQNPSATATTATLTFMDSSGTTATYSQSLAANSRMSYRINDSTNPTIANTSDVSTKVESSGGVGIIAERTMYWPEGIGVSKIGGHCSVGSPTTSTIWYLAEGSTESYVTGSIDGYDTWISVQNPSATATTVNLTFMDKNANIVLVSQSLAANSRMSYRVNDAMANNSYVSTKVESINGVGVIAERVMYWPEGVGRSKTGGHCSIGTPATSTTWYLAEGSTESYVAGSIDGYDTWISVQNPSATATTVNLTFMDKNANIVLVSQSLAANSRMSYRVNDAMANNSYVSTKVESSGGVGVIAERVMYWPEGIGRSKTGGHCSVGSRN